MKTFIKKYLFFLIAGLLVLISVTHAAVLIMNQIVGLDRQRLAFPGETELQLTPGVYTVFYEYTSLKKELDAGLLNMQMGITLQMNSDDVLLDITPLDQEKQVQMKPHSSSSYSINNVVGSSLYRFKIEQDGSYIIHTEYRDAQWENEHGLALTVIDSFGEGIFKLFKVIGLYFLAILLCCAVGLFQYLRGYNVRAILQK